MYACGFERMFSLAKHNQTQFSVAVINMMNIVQLDSGKMFKYVLEGADQLMLDFWNFMCSPIFIILL